jgi:hypothetical protein
MIKDVIIRERAEDQGRSGRTVGHAKGMGKTARLR